jgi:hypothetical protein
MGTELCLCAFYIVGVKLWIVAVSSDSRVVGLRGVER